MSYLYYPGCSLTGTAREYDLSTRALFEGLQVPLREIEDWTCCGASAAEAVSRLLLLSLSARNLALAERQDPEAEVLAPCSACYLNLKKAEVSFRDDPGERALMVEVLGEAGLDYGGRMRVRHILDVLSRDFGPGRISELKTRDLTGLKVAPYYGCQCLRPFSEFDDPEEPTSMEGLIRAAGAEVFHWDMGARCCGASNMTTKPEVGLKLTAGILEAARGADAVVTVCPMCQMNLEAYQSRASRLAGRDLSVTVLYLPQLLGLALGFSPQKVGLDLNLAATKNFRRWAA